MSHERTIPKRKDCLPIIKSRGELFVGLVWLISSYVGIFQLLGWKFKFSIIKYVIPVFPLNLFPPIFERRYISGIYECQMRERQPFQGQLRHGEALTTTPKRPRGTPIGGGTVAQRWCDRSIASSTCWLSM